MRRGYATTLIAAGFSVKEVSAWCGHSSTSVTLGIYAHLAAAEEDDAADRLDRLVNRSQEPAPTTAVTATLRAV